MSPLSDARLTRWARRSLERHPQREVVIALAGRGYFALRGSVYPCLPRDVFFIDRAEDHAYPYPPFYPDADHLLIQLTAGAALCRTYSLRGGKELAAGPTHTLANASPLIALLDQCIARARSGELPAGSTRFQLLALIEVLAGAFVQQGFAGGQDSPPTRKAYQSRMIRTVQDHIRETAGRGVTLASLAVLTGYSRHHLLRLFTSLTGQTVHGFLETVRVQKVTQLLAAGRSRKEVSAALGFSCPAAFSRWLGHHLPSLVQRQAHAAPAGMRGPAASAR